MEEDAGALCWRPSRRSGCGGRSRRRLPGTLAAGLGRRRALDSCRLLGRPAALLSQAGSSLAIGGRLSGRALAWDGAGYWSGHRGQQLVLTIQDEPKLALLVDLRGCRRGGQS